MGQRWIVFTVFAGGLLAMPLYLNAADGSSLPGPGAVANQNGDLNGDWDTDLSDAIYLFSYLYVGGPPPTPITCDTGAPGGRNGDINGDGEIDLSDGIYLLAWLYSSGAAPARACATAPGGGAKNPAPATPHPQYSDWSAPFNLGPMINSTANDQHPAISKDGLSLFISSDRPGGLGGLDIYVSQRASVDDPWGAPVNLGPNINSAGNDLAPTFSRDGHLLYFHSNGRGGCGGSDLFVSRRHHKRDDLDWQPAENLGCVVNSPFEDAGPTIFEDEETDITTLIFTSTRPGGPGDFDIYQSTRSDDEGEFGPAALVAELSGPYRDTRTAISRDGLELFLSSDVTGRPNGVGSQDLWVATRATTSDPWSAPVNLGPTVNSTAFDGTPALSFDGTTLYFFSERAGGLGKRDLYVTTRTRLGGPDTGEDAEDERQD